MVDFLAFSYAENKQFLAAAEEFSMIWHFNKDINWIARYSTSKGQAVLKVEFC